MKNRLEMKRILMIGGLVAAFLCLAQHASAQYAQIHRDGSDFVDNQGVVLSDQELIDLVGEDVFFETVVGARKQFESGSKLTRSGIITAGAGVTGMLVGSVLLATSEMGWDNVRQSVIDYTGQGTAGIVLIGAGCAAAAIGGVLLDVGLPFKIIGQSRLNWVENDYNDRARGYTLHVGAAPHGLGLTVNF